MLCTDAFENLAVHSSCDAVRKIPAQDIHVVDFGEMIAHLLHLNCCLRVALSTQELHTLSIKADVAIFAPRGLRRCHDDITEGRSLRSVHKHCALRHLGV